MLLLPFTESALSCRINLPRVASTADDDEDLELEQNSKKVGPCTWCKNIGKLSDFTTTIHGKEIYCTGLCSQKCFQEAAQKICNVESGTSVPVRYSSEPRPSPVNVPASNILMQFPKGAEQSVMSLGLSDTSNVVNTVNTGVNVSAGGQGEQGKFRFLRLLLN